MPAKIGRKPMAKNRDWFDGFVLRHIDRNPRADWPPADSEHWAVLQREFLRHGVREEVANAASENMAAASGFKYLGDHIALLMSNVKLVWASSEIPGEPPIERSDAEAQSRNCPDCHGNGLTIRYRHKSLVPGADRTITLYCTCTAGRWIERNHRTKSPEIRARIHDLADRQHEFLQRYACGWSDTPDNPWCYPPECWDHTLNRPIDGPEKLSDLLPKKRGKSDPTLVESFAPEAP